MLMASSAWEGLVQEVVKILRIALLPIVKNRRECFTPFINTPKERTESDGIPEEVNEEFDCPMMVRIDVTPPAPRRT